jgi:penicillin-binding protein 1A
MDRQLRGGILEQRAEAMSRPDWVPIGTLPAYVPRAFLTAVDPTFEDGGAVRARDESKTIPRELVREIHLLGNGLTGQAKELMMAPVLEHRASRREILELYLNRVYLGTSDDAPIYGIHYAAEEYLGKAPGSLTLGDAATLAGLLLEPRIDSPGDRVGAVGIRRNEVLRALASGGYITADEYRLAVAERLPFQPGLSEVPMSRKIFTPEDTAVSRLPRVYQTAPNQQPG